MPENKLDLAQINNDPGLHAALLAKAEEIASRATDLANSIAKEKFRTAEYGHGDLTLHQVGKERYPRPRAHVWAKNGPAIHAEIKASPLMQIVGSDGANKRGGSDVTYTMGT